MAAFTRDWRAARVVLVVEDNDRILRAEAEILRDCGYDVLTARNSTIALSLLTGFRIDLLITDVRLPGGLQGPGLARAVRSHWPAVKIVVVGVDMDQVSAEDRRALADDVLRKPFTVRELEERVANLIG
jgi:DNA-binding response OmpR family regulator